MALRRIRIHHIIVLAIIAMAPFSCQDNLEDLLEEKQFMDSLESKIPQVNIVSPAPNESVYSPALIRYSTTNWQIEQNGRHVQVFVNGENRKLSYNQAEVQIELDSGLNTLVLVLAHPNFNRTTVSDSVILNVLPLPDSLHVLTVENGRGSGVYPEGQLVNISAEIPEFRMFNKWKGDTLFVVDTRQSDTRIQIPDRDVSVVADILVQEISYSLEISPIISEKCLTCHSGLSTPSLITCQEMKNNINDVVLKLRDANDPMPPTGFLPEQQIRLIEEWARQGANCQ